MRIDLPATTGLTPKRRAGFTLLELVFVVGVLGLVITYVATIYVNITNRTERAADQVREIRSTTSILDRIANDIESAYLVRKEPEDDPLFHPWVFIAEGRRAQAGADRLMFTTVAHRSDAIAIDPTQRKSAAGLATYAYLLEPDPEPFRGGSFELLRWVNPFLAEDHSFPRPDDPAAMLVAENVASFSLRFQSETAGWQEAWDSTLISESAELPIAVEIRLALWPDVDEAALDFDDEIVPIEYRRVVVLYQRPMLSDSELGDLAAGGSDDEDDEDKNCNMTYAECLDLLRPNLKQSDWNRVYNNNCVEDGNEVLFDSFGVRVDFTKCGR